VVDEIESVHLGKAGAVLEGVGHLRVELRVVPLHRLDGIRTDVDAVKLAARKSEAFLESILLIRFGRNLQRKSNLVKFYDLVCL
jgi:hypothetical protein